MSEAPEAPPSWWARGLLFENCNCQVVCPGHTHFEQLCTHDTCIGYWAIRFDDGAYGEVPLAGGKAVVAYESPQRMIDGGWTERIIVDVGAPETQRAAMESILAGEAGGPWAVLGRFVTRRLPTEARPIQIADEHTVKRVSVSGRLESTIRGIRGRNRNEPVMFRNMFNQIHAPDQVIARGDQRYDDGVIVVRTEGTHGLYSAFHWFVSGQST